VDRRPLPELHNLKVDDLCPTVQVSTLAFDKNGRGCNPTNGNDCKVWTTGWQHQSIDLAALREVRIWLERAHQHFRGMQREMVALTPYLAAFGPAALTISSGCLS